MVFSHTQPSLCRRGASPPPRLLATRWNGSISWSTSGVRGPVFLPGRCRAASRSLRDRLASAQSRRSPTLADFRSRLSMLTSSLLRRVGDNVGSEYVSLSSEVRHAVREDVRRELEPDELPGCSIEVEVEILFARRGVLESDLATWRGPPPPCSRRERPNCARRMMNAPGLPACSDSSKATPRNK